MEEPRLVSHQAQKMREDHFGLWAGLVRMQAGPFGMGDGLPSPKPWAV